MTEHFCTYFDHRYLVKGLAMWRSLKKSCDSAILHVLCLNESCRLILAALRLPDVQLLSLGDLEAFDPELEASRSNRSLIEYYFTITPCLPIYLFNRYPDVSRLTYIDADLFFFADPQPIFDDLASSSIGIVEHRFPPRLDDRLRYGRFNVGWLTFRHDETALSCLQRWREQCLDWCYDRVEDGRFAEQKYLDDWPERFRSVTVIRHPGANVAPWNLNPDALGRDGQRLIINGEPLIFFHVHGFQPAAPGRRRDSRLADYGTTETPFIDREIFEPYERAIVEAVSALGTPLTLALLSDARQDAAALQEALKSSEADRAARLDVIHRMQRQLDQHGAVRATLLTQVDKLQGELTASEEDRATRVSVIHALEKHIESIEAHVAGVQKQLEQARARIDALEMSKSWRWTEPVRQVLDALGKAQRQSPR